ncbi:MAG: redoxin domain-containing protein [Anditalea sp.]
MVLKIGQKAPNFTLASTSGRNFTLSEDFKGKACVIYFYPRDPKYDCNIKGKNNEVGTIAMAGTFRRLLCQLRMFPIT